MDDTTNTSNPILTTSAGTPSTTESTQHGSHDRKRMMVIFMSVFLVLLFVGIFLLMSRKDQPQTTAPVGEEVISANDIVLATVAGSNLYKSSIVGAAKDQYSESAITDAVLKKFYNITIERAILNMEAKKQGIIVTDIEIASATNNNSELVINDVAKYNLLRDKIMLKQGKSVSAYTIGFWIPSFDYPQKPEYATQRTGVERAMKDIAQRLQNGESPFAVTEYTEQTYPDLPKLAINGVIFKTADGDPAIKVPRVFVLGEQDQASTSFNPDLFAVLQAIQPGQVMQATHRNGSGGTVVQAVEVSSTGYATYDEFLTAKKKEYIVIKNTL